MARGLHKHSLAVIPPYKEALSDSLTLTPAHKEALSDSLAVIPPYKEALSDSLAVIPAQAGIQYIKCPGCRPSPA